MHTKCTCWPAAQRDWAHVVVSVATNHKMWHALCAALTDHLWVVRIG